MVSQTDNHMNGKSARHSNGNTSCHSSIRLDILLLISSFSHLFIRVYIHTFRCSYVSTFIHQYVHTSIRSYINTLVRQYVHTSIRTNSIFAIKTSISNCLQQCALTELQTRKHYISHIDISTICRQILFFLIAEVGCCQY